MQEGIIAKVAEWSEGKISDDDLLLVLENSKPDLETHRAGFQNVVSDLNEAQHERCGEVVAFCFSMMDQIEEALAEAAEAISQEDRNTVFIAGDSISRCSFQLNQAFVEFRNQALMALGPTDIPNLNLLLQRRDDFLEDPSDNSALLFSEAIDAERIIVYHALEDLAKEPDLPEVATLINAFSDHRAALNDLAEILEGEAEEGDYGEIFAELEKCYKELQELVPMVQMKLRTQGETDYPDLNFLLSVMEDVAQGNLADGPLIDALESVDESFGKSKDLLAQACGGFDSALANEEVAAALESFEEFEDGIEALYRFLEERDRGWLVEAKGCLLEFAKRYSGHQAKLRKIEENQGKVLCPMCSTFNELSRTRCSKCGGPLPQNVAAATVTTFESRERSELDAKGPETFLTSNLEALYLAVNEVAAGTADHQTFLDAVAKFEGQIESGVGSLPAEPELGDPGKQGEVEKVYDVFERGVQTLREGLEIMKTYVDNQDEEVLAKAVKLVDEGARSVAAARDAVKG
jgi:hypothetical protein